MLQRMATVMHASTLHAWVGQSNLWKRDRD